MRSSLSGDFGIGWTVGLTKEENLRRSKAAVERWNAKGVDGMAKQKEFVDYQMARLGSDAHKAVHQWQLNELAPVREALLTGEPCTSCGSLGAVGQQVLRHV